MTEAPQTIDLQRIKALAPVIEEMSIGDDLVIGEVSGKRVERAKPSCVCSNIPSASTGSAFSI